MRRSTIIGTGFYVPPDVWTNDDMTKLMDTSDEWIQERTGIKQRHIAEDGIGCADLAKFAAEQAIADAGMTNQDIDMIIFATLNPDVFFPGSACILQSKMPFGTIPALDIRQQCTGFIYAVAIADRFIRTGWCDNILVIGAEVHSTGLDFTTRGRDVAVLFGDGAGALVLQANGADGGVLSSFLGADGSGGDLLCIPAGGSREPASHRTVAEGLHYLTMRGREVFRFAVRAMPSATRQVLEQAGLTTADLKLVIPHQANQRIIESSAKALGLPPETVFSNLEWYGNTSAASIPIALCEAVEQGRIQQDDLIVCVGFGAGLTWGATAIRWSVPLPAVMPSRWKKIWQKLRYRYAALRSLVLRFLRWLFALRIKE